jgi:hypothetical protein
LFEGRDPNMCGIQLATQELGALERARGLGGEGFQSSDSLAELIDFLGPASLVHLLSMFGELGASTERTYFGL